MFETVPFVRSGTLPFWKAIGENTASVVVQFHPSIVGDTMSTTMTGSSSKGIMFHHFRGENQPKAQGSISAEQFGQMIDLVQSNSTILSPSEYLQLAQQNLLKDHHTCLTFDDALQSQIKIALPVLDSFNIQGFFFVYSSAFLGNPDPLEIYRYFRTNHYTDFEPFFADFMSITQQLFGEQVKKSLYGFQPSVYLANAPFYSDNERTFRFLRDNVFVHDQYDTIMNLLMSELKFNRSDVMGKLFMSIADIQLLQRTGHEVGLHSHGHPTTMHKLDKQSQQIEYQTNYDFLKKNLGVNPQTMSHPNGNYSADTLDILREMGISLGFRATMSPPMAPSVLEIPREDHSNLLSKIST